MVNEPEVTGEESTEPANSEVSDEPTADSTDDVVIELVPELDPLDAAQAELKSTQARLRTVSKAYTELQGEMQSFKKRSEGQANLKALKRTADLVKALLEPIENLRRSVEHPGESVDSLVGGLKLVVHQFAEGLHRVGLRDTGKVGDYFDPRRHEALAMTPVMDRSQDGRILMVQTTGYVLGDNMLQPAQVIVGKYEAQEPPAPPPADEPEGSDVIDEASADTADADDVSDA